MTTIRNYPHNVLSIQWRDSKKMSFGQIYIHVHIYIHICKEQIPKLYRLFWNKLTSSNRDIQNDNLRFDLEKFRSKPTTPKQTDACAPNWLAWYHAGIVQVITAALSSRALSCPVMSCRATSTPSGSCIGSSMMFQCFFQKQNPLKSMVYVLTSFNICGVLYLFFAAW